MESDVAGMDFGKADSEKITINLGYVDLGRIDLLVREGFYANRTDFIRAAVRGQLTSQAADLKGGIERRRLELGLLRLSRHDLDAAVAADAPIEVNVVGLAVIAADVPPDLARAAIRSITVLGHLEATPAVRAALADRIH